jgi:lysophospholipase
VAATGQAARRERAGGALEAGFVRAGPARVRVRVAHARPPPGGAAGPRGTVVLLPGRAEFVEKHAETVGDLAARGYAVAVVEWRGQGLSDRPLPRAPERGHVGDFAEYLEDLAAALARAGELGLPRPYVMLAHSMGGQVGLRHLHDRPGDFAAAVMTAPMFGIRLAPLPVALARLAAAAAVRLGAAARYAPGQGAWDRNRCAFEGNLLTGCPDRFETWRRLLDERPELALGGVTYGWLAASLRSIALTRRPGYLEAIRTPVLVCQSGLERIVCNRSQEELVRRLPQGRLLTFPEARHEILMERPAFRERFLAAFDAFVAESVATERPAGASAAPPA